MPTLSLWNIKKYSDLLRLMPDFRQHMIIFEYFFKKTEKNTKKT